MKEKFKQSLNVVIAPLLEEKDTRLRSIYKRLKDLIYYNCTEGKMNRGCAVLQTAQILNNFNNNPEDEFNATVLGWCVEILQGYLLIADDIMDRSITRRGKLCWYKTVGGTGLSAINDSFILESSIYDLMKHYFVSKPYYLDCIHLLLETGKKTEYGQSLDMETDDIDKMDLSLFTAERYEAIVEYKTSYYSFHLPVALAMYMCGRDSPKELARAKEILLKIGHYFQIQDDFLDCYADAETLGKIGRDIEDRKCSWLFVTALKFADDGQKEVLMSNYGKENVESVSRVKAVYKELEMERRYYQFADTIYKEICDMINSDTAGLPPLIFKDFLDKIHKRSK